MKFAEACPWSSLEESLPETIAPALLLDSRGVIVGLNPERACLPESRQGDLVGALLESIVPPGDRGKIRSVLEESCGKGKTKRAETSWKSADPEDDHSKVSLLFCSLGEWTVVLIEKRERVEAFQKALDHRAELLSMHCEIASAVNSESEIKEVISCVLRRLARFNGWQFGHAFLRDQDDRQLLKPVSTAYTKEASHYEKFGQFTSQTTWREGEGLPGRVAAGGGPILAEDCCQDFDDKRVRLARELGLRSAFAFPILINAEVVGVLEFFSDKVIRDDSSIELNSIAAIGLQVGRVAERERSRRARQQSEEHLRLMTRQLRDAVWTYDPDSLRVTYANPALGEIWDLPRERLIGNAETWLHQVQNRDQSRARRGLGKLRQGKMMDEELRIVTDENEIRWIRLRCFPIGEEGEEINSIAATAEDITNYKKSQALQARLEKQLREVTEDERQRVARDLHDDLGGLLSAIGMRIEVLKQIGLGQQNPKHQESIKTIARLSEEAMATTRRLTRGLAPVGEDPDDLRAALKELVENIDSRGNIDCRFHAEKLSLKPDAPTNNQLFRIAHEAVTNAVKHSGGNTIEVRLANDAGDLVLSIVDDGCGLNGLKKNRGKGGYGLGTMRYRAEDIGADFFSEPGKDGKGLRITCRLPASTIEGSPGDCDDLSLPSPGAGVSP